MAGRDPGGGARARPAAAAPAPADRRPSPARSGCAAVVRRRGRGRAASRLRTARGTQGSTYRLPEIMGGGAALFDMDGDGDLDALLVQSGVARRTRHRPAPRLYRNDGTRPVRRRRPPAAGWTCAGYGMGVATGDYDGDGDADVYLTNLGAQRPAAATTAAAASPTSPPRRGVAGSRLEHQRRVRRPADADGWLDLFVTRYLAWSPERERQCFSLTGVVDYCSPKNYDAPSRSTCSSATPGSGTFTDVSTRERGSAAAAGNGLGVVADDVDGDGRADVFVANDGTPNHLWMNRGGGRFTESALALRRGHRPGRRAQGRHGRARRRRRRRRRQRPAGDEPRHRVRLVLPQRRPLLRRRHQQRRPAHGEPALHPLRHGARSTSTTTAGSISTRRTAASACRARPSPPIPTPSRTCCFRGVDGPAFDEVQPRGGTAAADRRDQPRRRLRRHRQRRRRRHPRRQPRRARPTCCATSCASAATGLLSSSATRRGSDALGAQC